MIREAIQADIPRIVEMGSRSLREGPYAKQLGDSPETTAKLAHNIIVNHVGRVLVAIENDMIIGLLGLLIYPHPYSGEQTCSEVIWYMEPEYRKSFTAIGLLRRGEQLARELGAKKMQFTAPTEEVGAAYKSLGYSQLEVVYQKAL